MSKTVLITGASTGFGRDTAETLSQAGHRVFASMRDPKGKNAIHAQDLQAQGISTLELDVTDERTIAQAVAHIKQEAGRIDVLINNAGIAAAGVTEAFSADQLASVFNVNVFGLHRVTTAVLPLMREQQSGLVINVGSILGRVTFPFFGMYGASKYAVEALSDTLRYEVSSLGVDVALVQPSAYPTHMYSSVTHPNNNACIESYGEVGQIPNAMFTQFMSMFESDAAPNPHDVAQAISTLIDTPREQRPARVVVGTSFGADGINQAVAPIQADTVRALGLDHLDPLMTS